MSQIIDSFTRGDEILHWLLTDTSDTMIGVCVNCSASEMVEFTHLRDIRKMKIKIKMPNFRKVTFQLLRELVNKTPWETALKDKQVEQSW